MGCGPWRMRGATRVGALCAPQACGEVVHGVLTCLPRCCRGTGPAALVLQNTSLRFISRERPPSIPVFNLVAPHIYTRKRHSARVKALPLKRPPRAAFGSPSTRRPVAGSWAAGPWRPRRRPCRGTPRRRSPTCAPPENGSRQGQPLKQPSHKRSTRACGQSARPTFEPTQTPSARAGGGTRAAAGPAWQHTPRPF